MFSCMRGFSMHSFFVNLFIGILGGAFSGVLVSRVSHIKGELDGQFDALRMNAYYLGTLRSFFDIIEKALKISSDTSEGIEKSIKKDPNYLKEHRILNMDDLLQRFMEELIVKTVNQMKEQYNPIALKQKEFIDLENRTLTIVQKYKDIETINFETVDGCIEEIELIKEAYNECFKDKNKMLIRLIVKDKVLIALAVIFVAIFVLMLI